MSRLAAPAPRLIQPFVTFPSQEDLPPGLPLEDALLSLMPSAYSILL